jgi:hypothetical protein
LATPELSVFPDIFPPQIDYDASMAVELIRLLLGLSLAWFHVPVADFMLDQERSLVVRFRQPVLGMVIPGRETARNLYFGLGVGIALIEILRIWMLTR